MNRLIAPIVDLPIPQYESYCDFRKLTANTQETFNVPAGAEIVNFSSDNDILVTYITEAQENLVENGTFASDTEWTKGSNWSIGSGVATAVLATSSLSQTLDKENAPIQAGRAYTLTYTITRSAGSIQPALGGTNGTSRNSGGTYTETIVAGSSDALLAFAGTGFSGTIDNVTLKPIAIVPSGDITGGVAPILNPQSRYIGSPKVTQISVISESDTNLSIAYYKQ